MPPQRTAKDRREKANELGICRDCRKQAIPNQTRCEACAEKHRVRRRQNDATRRKKKAAAEEIEDTEAWIESLRQIIENQPYPDAGVVQLQHAGAWSRNPRFAPGSAKTRRTEFIHPTHGGDTDTPKCACNVERQGHYEKKHRTPSQEPRNSRRTYRPGTGMLIGRKDGHNIPRRVLPRNQQERSRSGNRHSRTTPHTRRNAGRKNSNVHRTRR